MASGNGALAGLMLLAAGLLPPPGAAALPSVASMDYCADQYVLALATRGQIAALSRDATSVYSFFREKAAGIPRLRGLPEEVLALAPDIVVREWRGSPATDRLFRRAAIEPIVVAYAPTPEAALDNLVAIGSQIGRETEAKQFSARRLEMLEQLEQAPASELKALYVTPSGYSAGTGTSVDSIIKSAGLDTMAADYGLNGWMPLPVEAIVRTKPDLIVTSFFDLPAVTSRWSLVQSPHIGTLLDNLPVIDLPARYMTCSGLFAIDAAYRIRAEAARLGLVPALPDIRQAASQGERP